MKRRYIALLHAGYWTVYLLLLVVVFMILRVQFRQAPPLFALVASRIGLVSIVPNVVAFYLSYTVLFPRFLAPRRIAALVAAGTLGSVASAAVGILALYLVFGSHEVVFARGVEFAGLLAWLAAVGGIHMTIALVLAGFVGWYGDLTVKAELARKTHEMEMALLRSRIDPHFLFNTINNIDVLIARDPAAASAYLNALSEIMRFVLYDTRAAVIPLAAELDYIGKYLALEKIRSANPDRVRYEVAGDAAGLTIAPMIFIPFIENACTHAGRRRTGEAIVIHVDVAGRRITFHCRNVCGQARGPRTPGGLGNDLVRRRLALLYPGRHRLEVADRDGTYDVHLTIDTDDHHLHHR